MTDSAQSAARVEPPPHPMHALTTFELTGYRRQLESALASLGTRPPVPAARDDLQARLNAVLAEQDDREKIARA